MTQSIFQLSLDGKPECFANPIEFQGIRPSCESCPERNHCGATSTQLIEAVRSNIIPSAKMLKRILPAFDRNIEYWDEREEHPPTTYSSQFLEVLAQRMIDRQNCSGVSKKTNITKSEATARVSDANDFFLESTGLQEQALPMASISRPDQSQTNVKSHGADNEETPFSSAGLYQFPAQVGQPYEHQTDDELKAMLEGLVRSASALGSAFQYALVRDQICGIHIEMNLRQKFAPRFRSQLAMPRVAWTDDEKNFARDRQVIDLHWRAHSTEKPVAPVQDYPTIFEVAPFDFTAAAKFSLLEWRPQTKAAHLHVTDEMQWEHSMIQTTAIRDQWRVIENGDVRGDKVKQAGAPHVERQLRSSMAGAPHLKQHIPGLVQIWRARRIVGNSVSAIARMVALMSGEKVRDRSATRRSIQSLDAHLTNVKPRKRG